MNSLTLTDTDQRRRAGLAYLLYLANLTVLPGIGFIILLVLWRAPKSVTPFIQAHFQQAAFASVTAGVLLAFVSMIIVLAGGFQSPWTFVILILYFTLCHATLLLLGVLGFTRATNGKTFAFFSIRTWRS